MTSTIMFNDISRIIWSNCFTKFPPRFEGLQNWIKFWCFYQKLWYFGPDSYKNLTFIEKNYQISPFSIHFFVINIRIRHAITQWMCYWCIIQRFNHSIPNRFVGGVVTTRRTGAVWLHCSKWIYWTQTCCWIITTESNFSFPWNRGS